MKLIRTEYRTINANQVVDFSVSANYLVITTTDGREQKFFYGGEQMLKEAFDALVAFLAYDEWGIFNFDEFREDYEKRGK